MDVAAVTVLPCVFIDLSHNFGSVSSRAHWRSCNGNRMSEYERKKIYLNRPPHKYREIDMGNDKAEG